MLEGTAAKEAHDLIQGHYTGKIKDLPYPEVLKGKEIKGMFREDSYDWTVFRFYREGNKLMFSHRHHVQHKGECLKYLEKKIV